VFKAIGARNKDILMVFVLEAGLLSLTGGIIGVILGYLISSFAGKPSSTKEKTLKKHSIILTQKR